MAIERRGISGDTPRLGWWGGLVLAAAVVGIGVVVPAAVLLHWGCDPTWFTAILVAGVVIAWKEFIAILRLGRRRAWWR